MESTGDKEGEETGDIERAERLCEKIVDDPNFRPTPEERDLVTKYLFAIDRADYQS